MVIFFPVLYFPKKYEKCSVKMTVEKNEKCIKFDNPMFMARVKGLLFQILALLQSTELSCVSLMNSEKLISEDSLCDL